MTPIASRLKDVLWSVRQQFGLENDIDRLISFIAFERTLTEDQLNDLFISYPKRIPEEFRAVLIARIQQIIRQYWAYCQTQKGYHKVLRGVLFLENVCRYKQEGCRLVDTGSTGYRLELKPVRKGK